MFHTKRRLLIIGILACFFVQAPARQDDGHMARLKFIIGNWESRAVDKTSGEESKGISSVTWALNGRWLKWNFRSDAGENSVEVLTMITFQPEDQRYAFYSFNSRDTSPLPHYGNWISADTLLLTIHEETGEMHIRIIPEKKGGFRQIHESVNADGRTTVRAETVYRKR